MIARKTTKHACESASHVVAGGDAHQPRIINTLISVMDCIVIPELVFIYFFLFRSFLLSFSFLSSFFTIVSYFLTHSTSHRRRFLISPGLMELKI